MKNNPNPSPVEMITCPECKESFTHPPMNLESTLEYLHSAVEAGVSDERLVELVKLSESLIESDNWGEEYLEEEREFLGIVKELQQLRSQPTGSVDSAIALSEAVDKGIKKIRTEPHYPTPAKLAAESMEKANERFKQDRSAKPLEGVDVELVNAMAACLEAIENDYKTLHLIDFKLLTKGGDDLLPEIIKAAANYKQSNSVKDAEGE